MNIGVIGAGLMGTTHIRILSAAVSGARVVAVSDAFAESAERVAAENGVATVYADALRADPRSRRRGGDHRLAGADARGVHARLPAGGQAGAVREAAGIERRGEPARGRGRGGARPPAGPGRVHAPLRPRLRASSSSRLDAGEVGAPLRRPLRAPQPRRPADLHVGDADHATRSCTRSTPSAGCSARRSCARRSSRRAPRASPPSGLQDPQVVMFETGVRPARGRRVLRQRAVRLRHPLRGRGRDRHARARGAGRGHGARAGAHAIDVAPASSSASATPTCTSCRPGSSAASRRAPDAWDGYAAAAVCEAAVESLRTGRTVDVQLAIAVH